MIEKECLNEKCNKLFLTKGNKKWCSDECRWPSKPCSWVECSNLATKSNYCSIACRNKHISLLSRDKNREAQNRPDVRLKKSIAQKKAFENIETKEKHKNAVIDSYKNGREAWNKGLNKKVVSCEQCKKEFIVNGYQNRRYCSILCSLQSKVKIKSNVDVSSVIKISKTPWNKGLIQKKELFCLNCNASFSVHLGANRKFCSKACEGIYRTKRTMKICPYCQKSFLGKPKAKYCSKKCSCIANQTIKIEGMKNKYGFEKRSNILKETWDKNKDNIISKRNTPEYLEKLSALMAIRSKNNWVNMSQEDIKIMVQKAHATKKRNNSYGKSKYEDLIFQFLKQVYPDTQRQYSDKRYPFSCDFYISQLDLFIEYQGSWTHGKEPFDGNNLSLEWIEKAKDSDYYKNAIDVFSFSDPLKRDFAYSNKLNYLELWGEPSQTYIYKQINRVMNGLSSSSSYEECFREFEKIKLIKGGYNATANTNKIILTYQKHFYEKENKLFKNSKIQRELILNRIKYLNKNEEDLTDKELLRGFKISGKYYGYSHFSPLWIKAFIEEFKINSIYDPCAGWGHRLIGAQKINYIGNDLNTNTYNGLKRIVNDFDLKDKIILNNDCREYIPNFNYEAVFTCPPYYDTEDYQGEILPSYQEWLKTFWDKTVKNCLVKKPKYFAFVMGKKYSEDFKKITYNNNLLLVKDVPIGGAARSHFTRHSDLKPKNSDILSIFSC